MRGTLPKSIISEPSISFAEWETQAPKFGFGSGSDRSGREFHTSNIDYPDSNICIKDVCRSFADLEDENV